MTKPYQTDDLDALLAGIRERFDVRFEPVRVADSTIEVLQIADLNAYVDKLVDQSGEGPVELPFWAKIWPSSILLSFYLSRLPSAGRRVLEIGAGVGVTGLYAALHGFRVTISDVEEDSLLFARANVLKNGLADVAEVRYVDFTQDRLDERFDLILGCEVLYQEEVERPVLKFLERHLASDAQAEAVLAMSHVRKAKRFFSMAEKEFHVDTKYIGCRETPEAGQESEDERHLCAIHRLRPRKRA